MTVFLGVGSNLGDREANLKEAREELARTIHELRSASLYETLPQDYTEQPLFLNTVLCGSTELAPEPLLSLLHEIERRLGRKRHGEQRYGPRTIDIDILLYGEAIINTPQLTVPHPRMSVRKFVLIPLLELAPDLADPVSGKRYSELLARLPPQGIYYFNPTRYSHELESEQR